MNRKQEKNNQNNSVNVMKLLINVVFPCLHEMVFSDEKF